VFQQPNHYWRIVQVFDGSAASTAGLQPNDRIVATNGQPVKDFSEVRDFIRAHPNDQVTLDVVRDGHRVPITATVGVEDGKGKLGVQSSEFPADERIDPVTAVGRSFSEFGSGMRESFSALGRFFSPSGIGNFVSQVASGGEGATVGNNDDATAPSSGEPSANEDRPISIWGAAAIGSDLTRNGFYEFLAFFLTINLFIGIVNLMPLLPLDGGHVLIATYERLRSRRGQQYRVDVVKLLPLTYVVVMLLVLLFVGTLFLDIVDPVRIN
jgi:membrane-associated protease RseP (regulator of RpoE activity)